MATAPSWSQSLRIFTRKPLFHLYTLWLFTRSDLKTIIGPSTAFGIIGALSGPALLANASSSGSSLKILSRVPAAAFWSWINLLPFAIENQRLPAAIREDSINKPWRPLPSKRVLPEEAKTLMLALYLLALLFSLALGGVWQCLALMLLGYWYNDLKGADNSCITRNFINACGYISFTSGALEVTSNSHTSAMSVYSAEYSWFFTVGAVVFTTIQSQDLYDQAGDKLVQRWTVPLVIGDSAARWSIAVPVMFWSYFCPAFWQIRTVGYFPPFTLAMVVAWRTLRKRGIVEDKTTFKIYNVWIISIFALPYLRNI